MSNRAERRRAAKRPWPRSWPRRRQRPWNARRSSSLTTSTLATSRESAAGLAIAGIATIVILGHVPRVDGSIFLASLAAYFLVRQSLLRLRAERREFLWRRNPTTSGA